LNIIVLGIYRLATGYVMRSYFGISRMLCVLGIIMNHLIMLCSMYFKVAFSLCRDTTSYDIKP